MSSLHEQRPLSPHLQVYKPQITSMMSITHRLTGVALSLGSILLVAWLWSAAYSDECYQWLMTHLDAWYGRLALVGWTFALFYHLLNGIRHLFWDTGRGFKLHQVTFSGVLVLLSATALTVVSWLLILQQIDGLELL